MSSITIITVGYHLAQQLLVACLLGLTRKHSPVRYMCSPLVLLLGYHAFLPSLDVSQSNLFCAFCAVMAFSITLHRCNLLLINPVDDFDLRPARQGHSDSGIIPRVLAGFAIAINLRGIGTPWQTKNTPQFPAYVHDENGLNRRRYLIRQTAVFLWQTLVIDILNAPSMTPPEDAHQGFFGPGMEFTILTASRQQLMARVLGTLATWLLVDRVLIDRHYRLLSIVFVGSGLSSPAQWPPVFGSIREIYTIRNFWGKFWHQLFRSPFQSHSTLLTQNILHLPHPSLIERYTNIFTVFLLSGIMHVLQTVTLNLPDKPGTLLFFLCNALAVLLEDFVQWIYTRYDPSVRNDGPRPWMKAAGFVWVLVWMGITSPWYFYPLIRLPPDMGRFLPWYLTDVVGPGPVAAAVVVGAGGLVGGFGAGM